ncbi:MAG: amidohydrolase family protein [Actinomycetes bacterium]
MPIDPATDAYVLDGRVVTMGPRGVISDGRIYLRGRNIEAVGSSADPVPAGFGGAPRVATGGTIYPGLIELHNHLAYNAMPLWDVPKRYSNNGQWRSPSNQDYRRRITKPSQVLGQTPGVLQALVRYVECRAMLGGVTSTQGITLANAGGITRYFKGLVRNVEQPIDPALKAAGTNIANPAPGGAQAYLDRLGQQQGCYLQHLSEGTDDTARGWFLNLQIDDQNWAITDALCGIHAAALLPEQLGILADRGGSMVWSPTSNYLLYGATADIAGAKASQIRIALGSDWAPSGTKNLLGELKVAWLASREHSDAADQPLYSDEELVQMVTINPARMLRWHEHLGSIEAGKWADLVVVNGRAKDPYRQLIEARETSVSLLIIDGVPRVGRTSLMARFGPGTETITIGGASSRVLNLADPNVDPLVGAETLGGAIQRLTDAMANLPQLAADIDSALTGNQFIGADDGSGQQWRILPDFEEDDIQSAAREGLNLAAEDYASWVEPMTLDPITVADDHDHLRSLVAARNLPEFVKKGLPGLYGRTIPLPDSAGFLTRVPPDRVPQVVLQTTRELREFARTSGELSLEDRRTIVDQAMLVLQENYVHLPLKAAMYGVDPVQRMRVLRRRLDDQPPDKPLPPEASFHAEVTEIFNSVRDLHTGYRLPAPFNSRVAWLPFLVEECEERGRPMYLVSKVVANAGPADFKPGVEITHWNGMTIDQAVARNGDRQAGGNPSARHARGVNSLTLRPLSRSLPPDEEWVTIRYRAGGAPSGKPPVPSEYIQPWLVFEPGQDARPSPVDLIASATAMGVDDHTDDIQQARKILFAPGAVLQAEERSGAQLVAEPIAVGPDDIATTMPGVFRARPVQATGVHPDQTFYGYVRIFTFNVADARAFIDEFARLVDSLPDRGLIIDVRGNGGGLIHAAEGLLQVLTRRPIQPEVAQFITTATNLRICRRHAPSAEVPGLTLTPWIQSMSDAVMTGATYSHGFPITPVELLRDISPTSVRPCVLITDPLCYSATDMFAAGFQDHGIGRIIGVGGATGAGGANVWSHGLLRQLLPPDAAHQSPTRYQPLPRGADLRVAIRRTTRVADNPGDVLEDLGVTPDIVYQMTAGDILEGNVDLINRAIEVIASHQIDPTSNATEPRRR